MVSLRAVEEAAGLQPAHVLNTADLREVSGSDGPAMSSSPRAGAPVDMVSAVIGMDSSGDVAGQRPRA